MKLVEIDEGDVRVIFVIDVIFAQIHLLRFGPISGVDRRADTATVFVGIVQRQREATAIVCESEMKASVIYETVSLSSPSTPPSTSTT
jgi:hypothetical protein